MCIVWEVSEQIIKKKKNKATGVFWQNLLSYVVTWNTSLRK